MAKKTVVLAVTGGIAAYKSPDIVSRLIKLGYSVRVVMTENATEFITPLTMETMSGNKVAVKSFDKGREFEVEHISLAKSADAILIAPATANVIGKIADGIADDLLTTTIMAARSPVIICPAMNTAMYDSPAVTENIAKLKGRGCIFVEPSEGRLACGDTGKGKLAEPETIVNVVDSVLTPMPDYRGKTVLITAGATREPIDAVRYITNRSSGKMGAALAEAALNRGANVIMVVGFMSAPVPNGATVIKTETTEQMFNAVMENLGSADIIIKAAAPSDYKVKNFSPGKIKAESLKLELIKNPDIAAAVGAKKGERKLAVFAAETNDLIENAMHKLKSKNADLIVANDVTAEGAGFDCDTNIATLLKSDGVIESLDIMSKSELADVILDTLKDLD